MRTDPALVERAKSMRAVGMTTTEIAAALGVPRRGGVMRAAAAAVPAQPRTRRMRAKDDLRLQAFAMRREGCSYDEIQRQLHVSKGSLSLWLRDLDLDLVAQAALNERRAVASRNNGRGKRRATIARDEWYAGAAQTWLGELTPRELALLGTVAYWCEGAKSKAWRPSRRVSFINSDEGVIRLFMAWLAGMGVRREDCTFRVHIHESADIDAALRFWSDVIQVPVDGFLRTTLKRHNPSTTRRNIGEPYVGCLIIDVRRSADLYRKVAGLFRAVVEALPRLDAAGLEHCAGLEPVAPGPLADEAAGHPRARGVG